MEHLPSDKLILALIQFYISGEGREEEEGTQYHLDKPHQFSSPITAPNIVAGIVWAFCCLLANSEKAWSSYQFIMVVYSVAPLLYLIFVFWLLIRSKFVLITNCHSHTSLLCKIKR